MTARIKARAADNLNSRIQRQGSTGSILGLVIVFAQNFVYTLPNLIIIAYSDDSSQWDYNLVVKKHGFMTGDLKF